MQGEVRPFLNLRRRLKPALGSCIYRSIFRRRENLDFFKNNIQYVHDVRIFGETITRAYTLTLTLT